MKAPMLRGVVALALVASSVAQWAGSVVAAGEQVELPETLEVRLGADISPRTAWYVETALHQAWAYFQPHLSDPDDFDAIVAVVTNVDDAAKEWASERGIAPSKARRLFRARSSHYAGLATTGLTVIINDNTAGPGATIHEVTHLVQHHLAGRSQGPRWLSEGAAQYFDLLIEHEWGIDAAAAPPQASNREIAKDWATTLGNCRASLIDPGSETCRWAQESLHRLESAQPFDVGGGAVSAYHRASVAFQQLIDNTSVDSYFCFLERQGDGISWRGAFQECFAMEVADFYDQFDRIRAGGFARPAPVRNVRL